MKEQYAPPSDTAVESERSNFLARQSWEVLRPVFVRAAALNWLKRFIPSRRPDFTAKQ
jgi:hypothetical protein